MILWTEEIMLFFFRRDVNVKISQKRHRKEASQKPLRESPEVAYVLKIRRFRFISIDF